MIQKPCRDELPFGRLHCGQLHRRLGKGFHLRIRGHGGLAEALKFQLQGAEGINLFLEILLDLPQEVLKGIILHLAGEVCADAAQGGALFTVQDICLCHLIVSALHEYALHLVLYAFHGQPTVFRQALEDDRQHFIERPVVYLLRLAGKCLFHGVQDLFFLERDNFTRSFSDIHRRPPLH